MVDFKKLFEAHGDHHQQLQDVEKGHKASFSHEVIAGAAAFAAAKAYEKHQAETGEPPSHAVAKEIFAAASAAFIDHLVETKGLDYVDAAKAKRDAKKRAEEALDEE